MKKVLSLFDMLRPLMLPTAISDAFLGTGCAGLVFGSVVGWDIMLYASLMSLLLYASGMVMNDIFDAKADKIEGRDRPLTTGAVSIPAALLLLAVLLCCVAVIGFFLATPAVITYTACFVVIVAYNLVHKKYPVVSPFLMGAARSLSLLGAAAAFNVRGEDLLANRVVLAIAISYGLYVTAVTFFSLLEDKVDDLGFKCSAVFAALLAVTTLVPLLQDGVLMLYFGLFAIVVLSFLLCMWYLLWSGKRRAKLGAYTPVFITPLLLLGGIGLFVLSVGDSVEQLIVPSSAMVLCYPVLSLYFYIRAERTKVTPAGELNASKGEL